MPPSSSAPRTIHDVKVDHTADDRAVIQQGDSAWKAARRNLRYLYDPQHSPSQPTRFRTRALLRSLRYTCIFVFWRLVRWAKYVAVGSLIAAVSASALGGAVTGVAWIAAPPTIGMSILSACVWQAGKYAARRLNKRWKKEGEDVDEDPHELAHDESPLRSSGTYGQETGLQAMPW